MQAIHVTGSDSFLCQGDFLNGTSPSGDLTMLKACFTIKTIHNYSGLIIIFYHSFSSCREWGQRGDQDPVYCCADSAAQGLQDPVEAGKCTQAGGSGDRSEMGEPINSTNEDSDSQFWAPAACCFQHLLFSHLFRITEMMNWKNAMSSEALFIVFIGNRLSVLSG